MTLPKITEAEAEELTARHTKEPWIINVLEGETLITTDKPRIECKLIAKVYGEAKKTNAHRIVASVNACVGMADPDNEIAILRLRKSTLDLGSLKRALSEYQVMDLQWLPVEVNKLEDDLTRLRQDKAELLAELQKIADGDFPEGSYTGGEISSEEERAYHYQWVAKTAIAKTGKGA